ncbi:MAG: TauD/TfdA family dioxygenase [Rhodospirillaceae bacterium]|jgi:taurine dioxygenase|nr:TauD/TfdA family dioxygenase [Rhodospirillaceae bacterium]
MTDVVVTPSGAALGAEISGVDLSRPLSEDEKAQVRGAFLDHKAIYFREQDLSDPELLEFSSVFGEALFDPRPVDYHRELDTEFPGLIDVVSNVEVDGKPIGALGAGEAIWHTDTMPLPNSALILHGLEVPSGGPNTRFVNTAAVFRGLPDALKEKIARSIVIHGRKDYDLIAGGENEEFDRSQSPGPWFPLVRRHGETSEQALFLGREGDGYIVGLPVEESDAILEEIWSYVLKPEFRWEHSWQKGDVLVWDNRCTVHSRGKVVAGRRRMHRTTVSGEWPSW